MDTKIQVRYDKGWKDRIKKAAAEKGMSMSEWIRNLTELAAIRHERKKRK